MKSRLVSVQIVDENKFRCVFDTRDGLEDVDFDTFEHVGVSMYTPGPEVLIKLGLSPMLFRDVLRTVRELNRSAEER